MIDLLLELLLLAISIRGTEVIVFLITIIICSGWRNWVTLSIGLVLLLHLILLIVVVETGASIATIVVAVASIIIVVVPILMILWALVRVRSTLIIGAVRIFPFNDDSRLILILSDSFLHHGLQRATHLVHLAQLVFYRLS